METPTQDHVVQDLDSPEIPTNPGAEPSANAPTTDVADAELRRHSIPSPSAPVMLSLDLLDPHPQNPRLVRRGDVIEEVRASIMVRGFDPARGLIVQPRGNRYEILDGDIRADAARLAGLIEVPCWVRDLDDNEAYMLLLTLNAQREPAALERGMHALNSGMDVKTYAKTIGRPRSTVQDEVSAAKVAQAVPDIRHDLVPYPSQLVAIRTARSWLWPALARALAQKRWTVGGIRAVVGRLKDLPADRPKWVSDGFCDGLVAGTVPPDRVRRIEDLLTSTAAELQEIERRRASASGDDPPMERFGQTTFEGQMAADGVSFSTHADALNYCNGITETARQRLPEISQLEAKEKNQGDGRTEPDHAETLGEVKDISETPELEQHRDAAQEENQAARTAEQPLDEQMPPLTSVANEEPVTSNRVPKAGLKQRSYERSKEFYAERHARRLHRRARFGVTRIARSVQILAALPIPPPHNLVELLSPRYQAALRRYSTRAFANLKEYEPVINGSTTADE